MSLEKENTAASWQWICGVNSSDDVLFNDFQWDKKHVLNNTCLIDVINASPHSVFLIVFSLILLGIFCFNYKRVTPKFVLRFPNHSAQWILMLLVILMQLGAASEGILTDVTYRYSHFVSVSTQPHLYVPGACGFVTGTLVLVFSHTMELWRMANMIWLLLMYWILAVAGQVAQILSLLYQDKADVNIMRFDFCVTLLVLYALLVINTLNIIRIKVCYCGLQGHRNQVIKDLRRDKMFYMERYSNFLSDKTYWWVNWVLRLGYKRPLVLEDLGSMPEEHSAAHIHRTFAKAFKHVNQQKDKDKDWQPSLFKVYMKVHGACVAFALVLKLVADLLIFVGPVALTGIIDYANIISKNSPEVSEEPHFISLSEYFENGYILVAVVFMAAIVRLLLLNLFDFWMQLEGCHLRSSLQTMIYEKSLRISITTISSGDMTMGEINNHISTDAQNMGYFLNFGLNALTLPIMLVLAVVLLYVNIGVSSLIGLSLFILVLPFQSIMAAAIAKTEKQVLEFSDNRLKYINEMLQSIKLIKLSGWEDIFIEAIERFRHKEITGCFKMLFTYSLISGSSMATPLLVTLLSFAVYQPLTGETLTPAKAFSTLTLFSLLGEPMMMIPQSLYMCTSCFISTRRLQKFFAATEVENEDIQSSNLLDYVDDETTSDVMVGPSHLQELESETDSQTPLLSSIVVEPEPYATSSTPLPDHLAVKITSGNFAWGKEAESSTLHDINLDVPKGQLTMVIGAVGSGKSSLLSAILGEMTTESGCVEFSSNSIAYANQKPWLLNDTMKDNVLFGLPSQSSRYKEVIASCALQPDIDILPAGDQTEIGEKGINLSGGQKQRVSVARAMYARKDIVLLDDPLSALDGHVGAQMFNDGILGLLLKNGQTVVLVTHQLQYLSHADKIVIMKDGRVEREGVLADIAEAEPELYSQYEKSVQTDTDEEVQTVEGDRQALKRQISRQTSHQMKRHISHDSQAGLEESDDAKGKLIEDEERELGSVSFKVYFFYLRSITLPLMFAVLLAYTLRTVFDVATSFWLSKWSSDNVNPALNTSSSSYYVGVYGGLTGGASIFSFIASVALVFATIATAKKIFLKMLHTIAHMPNRFFDTTPVGRIINRFSSDFEIIDMMLMFNIDSCMIVLLKTLSAIIINVIVTPIFIVIILPVVITFIFLQKVFLTTSRELQRINNITRSPVYAFFSESLVGLSTIRAYRSQRRFFRKILKYISDNNVAFVYLTACNSWLGVRLDFIAALVVLLSGLSTLIAASLTGLDASLVGLAISYALQISGYLNYLMRILAELEMQMNSVERIKHYSSLTPESQQGMEPPLDWPTRGEIELTAVSARYAQDLDPVLQDVSLHIKAGQKVGICGRTGSGKSSLTLTLLRMIDMYEGELKIDGIDIQCVCLTTLRKRLSIIPQDPVLFNGSIRMNLDPSESISDAKLWDALEIAQLKNVVTDLQDGLEFQVSEGGDNFSMGQRQLFCLARAFLRKSRILIMDEATASIDTETDKILQEVVATAFADRTVLTIAHRISSILESDIILVLEQGRIIEHDSPANLLADDNSAFTALGGVVALKSDGVVPTFRTVYSAHRQEYHFSGRRAEYTVRNVETTTSLFRATTPP